MATKRTAGGGTIQAPEQELVITRLLDAPREDVFQAWIDPIRLKRWWGPHGFTLPSLEADLRPGGEWSATMRSAEGKDYPQQGVFQEIVPPERLVYTFKWVGESDPESLVTVTFTERGDQTEMTFHQGDFTSVESRDSHEDGWSQSFDRLAEELANPKTRQQAQIPEPAPELKRLNVFLGKWHTEGEAYTSPESPPAVIVATDIYEWLEGGFFMIHHVDGRVGGDRVKVIEIIGYDPSSQTYYARSFDSQGNAGVYQATVRDDVWTFSGESERATVVPGDGGRTLTALWERRSDGSKWVPWMEVKLKKVETTS